MDGTQWHLKAHIIESCLRTKVLVPQSGQCFHLAVPHRSPQALEKPDHFPGGMLSPPGGCRGGNAYLPSVPDTAQGWTDPEHGLTAHS